MEIFIDLQGFKGVVSNISNNNDFILKELCLLSIDNIMCHSIFKPPYSLSHLPPKMIRTYRWLERNGHGINWYSGWVDYYKIPLIIEKYIRENNYNNCIIWVKGNEKIKWVSCIWPQSLSYSIRNIEEYNYSKRIRSNTDVLKCFHHKGVCALNNVIHMYNWWKGVKRT